MSQLGVLLKNLDAEIQAGTKVSSFIDDLQMFVDHREDEKLVGLEQKLSCVGRQAEYRDALRKKEFFQKKLTQLEHFVSAQKLFAVILSRIHEVFQSYVMDLGQPLPRHQVEEIVDTKIVQPTIDEINHAGGSDHLLLTHSFIRGMIFWLADRCWVRWH